MVSIGSSSYSKRLLHLVSWSHWFTFFNMIAAILLSSFYLFNEAAPETFLGKIYLFTNWTSHMGFLTFIGFVLFIFPLTLIYPKTRFIRGAASIAFTLGLLLLLLDAFIYSRLGYHLNASSSGQILSLIQRQIEANNRAFWFISLVLFFAIFSFQLVISNYAWKHLRDLQDTIYAKFVVIGLVASFIFSHVVHIWADANLEYDILRQDTVLPLSYPSTAKTLLTKYGLFDKTDYMERRTNPLSFGEKIPNYPSASDFCSSESEVKRAAFIVLSDELLTEQQIERFSQRTSANAALLTKHIDNALPEMARFNFLFGLPSIYQEGIFAQRKLPILFDALKQRNLTATATILGTSNQVDLSNYEALFDEIEYLENISSFVVGDRFKDTTEGLHVIYFNKDNSYQFELFVDALLLAQRHKKVKDTIWISSLGNHERDTRLSFKPALYINPNGVKRTVTHVTSHMDVVPSLMNNWLGCRGNESEYSVGTNISTLRKDRVIANTVPEGIMVFNKDKSVLVDQNGNFQSFSVQLNAPITVSKDFPLMIDGVHFIKQFVQKDTAD